MKRYLPGLVLLVAVAGFVLFRALEPAAPEFVVAGTGGVPPRADAASERLLPEALAAAGQQAADARVRALLVNRRGHRVFDYFAAGTDGHASVDGGQLGAAVFTLVLHQPEDAQADASRAAALVSERLWLPLRAADARYVERSTGAQRCCLHARLDDWMRVGDLLNGQGAYLGERILGADAVRQLLAAQALESAGDEPFLGRDGKAFDLAPGVRLWLAPQRNLSILVWAADARQSRDARLPNIILRGLDDPSPAIGGDVADMVPGH